MKTIIGIDPGKGGAVAILEPDGSLTIWDLGEFYSDILGFNCLDAAKFNRFVDQNIYYTCGEFNALAVCESPQIRHEDGIKTARSVYRSDGTLECVFHFHSIDFMYVNPRTWKKFFGLSSDKADSVDRAIREFPDYKDFFIGPRGGKKDGRAEAALIALYARKTTKE